MTDEAQIENSVVEKPVAKFVNEEGRSRMIPLEYPVEFDGKLWTEIEIRRVTGGQMDAYMKAVVAGENVLPPVIACPMPVWEAMDADDQFTVDQAAAPFMPKRLKRLMAATAGAPVAERED